MTYNVSSGTLNPTTVTDDECLSVCHICLLVCCFCWLFYTHFCQCSRYPPVTSDSERHHYKADFTREYSEYLRLHDSISQRMKTFSSLSESLKQAASHSPEYEVFIVQRDCLLVVFCCDASFNYVFLFLMINVLCLSVCLSVRYICLIVCCFSWLFEILMQYIFTWNTPRSVTLLYVLLSWFTGPVTFSTDPFRFNLKRSETLRPHHRRTHQPSLAAGPGAHTV